MYIYDNFLRHLGIDTYCIRQCLIIESLISDRGIDFPNFVQQWPPITVRISEACPGQSTRVNCTCASWASPADRRWDGSGTQNDEKPRSSVIPRSLLCGFLSKHAVLATVLSAFARLVFPLSTWPSTPTLKFKTMFFASAITNETSFRKTRSFFGKTTNVTLQKVWSSICKQKL